MYSFIAKWNIWGTLQYSRLGEIRYARQICCLYMCCRYNQKKEWLSKQEFEFQNIDIFELSKFTKKNTGYKYIFSVPIKNLIQHLYQNILKIYSIKNIIRNVVPVGNHHTIGKILAKHHIITKSENWKIQ